MLDYKSNFDNAMDFALKKASADWWKIIVLGILASIYVGIGYIAYIYVAAAFQGNLIGIDSVHFDGSVVVAASATFPVGLMLIVFLGGSLFTSDNLSMLAYITKKTKFSPLLRKWGYVLLGNTIGGFLIAILIRAGSIFNDNQLIVLKYIIDKKIDFQWWTIIFSAILCNIIVAGTVWASLATTQSIGKIFIIFFPIWIFAIIGFQHVVANAILFAMGWLHGDNPIIAGGIVTIGNNSVNYGKKLIDWTSIALHSNLIPALIGNWFAGSILLPYAYLSVVKIRSKSEKQRMKDNAGNLTDSEDPDKKDENKK
ncbi:formate/nitrite transporter family protein [[Mycoplasma] mobile]|uniref:Formate/nitrite family of transporters n=1 Tax=Mycoplasma mobile (strain ATCC 43663 / 163K / NCTC 11711) TaxID=267748 RepID=Q6KI69_MYCM1|nr:formate/nitrite transporter family protein [[Mycoplasma] mobile]AAT27707.1 formate/nitrite family of transporters [Mycoplasma mobile 163K]